LSPIALHLLSCHVPLVGGVFAAALLIAGRRRGQPALTAAADVGTIAVALFAALAWATGPAALSHLEPWMNPASEAFADRHSGLGEFAVFVWAAAALVAAWGVFLRRARTSAPSWRVPVLFGLIVVALGMSLWAGYEGGRIRHEELRHGAGPIASGNYE
jgi:hypothetical protein